MRWSAQSLDFARGCLGFLAPREAPSTVRAPPLGPASVRMHRSEHAEDATTPGRSDHHAPVLGLEALWLRWFALGTMHTAPEWETLLRGEACPTRHQYNIIAVALSEYCRECGATQLLPYLEDEAVLTTRSPLGGGPRATSVVHHGARWLGLSDPSLARLWGVGRGRFTLFSQVKMTSPPRCLGAFGRISMLRRAVAMAMLRAIACTPARARGSSC